jgi:hypothetical protein
MEGLPEYADEADSVRIALAREFQRSVRRSEYQAANDVSNHADE